MKHVVDSGIEPVRATCKARCGYKMLHQCVCGFAPSHAQTRTDASTSMQTRDPGHQMQAQRLARDAAAVCSELQRADVPVGAPDGLQRAAHSPAVLASATVLQVQAEHMNEVELGPHGSDPRAHLRGLIEQCQAARMSLLDHLQATLPPDLPPSVRTHAHVQLAELLELTARMHVEHAEADVAFAAADAAACRPAFPTFPGTDASAVEDFFDSTAKAAAQEAGAPVQRDVSHIGQALLLAEQVKQWLPGSLAHAHCQLLAARAHNAAAASAKRSPELAMQDETASERCAETDAETSARSAAADSARAAVELLTLHHAWAGAERAALLLADLQQTSSAHDACSAIMMARSCAAVSAAQAASQQLPPVDSAERLSDRAALHQVQRRGAGGRPAFAAGKSVYMQAALAVQQAAGDLTSVMGHALAALPAKVCVVSMQQDVQRGVLWCATAKRASSDAADGSLASTVHSFPWSGDAYSSLGAAHQAFTAALATLEAENVSNAQAAAAAAAAAAAQQAAEDAAAGAQQKGARAKSLPAHAKKPAKGADDSAIGQGEDAQPSSAELTAVDAWQALVRQVESFFGPAAAVLQAAAADARPASSDQAKGKLKSKGETAVAKAAVVLCLPQNLNCFPVEALSSLQGAGSVSRHHSIIALAQRAAAVGSNTTASLTNAVTWHASGVADAFQASLASTLGQGCTSHPSDPSMPESAARQAQILQSAETLVYCNTKALTRHVQSSVLSTACLSKLQVAFVLDAAERAKPQGHVTAHELSNSVTEPHGKASLLVLRGAGCCVLPQLACSMDIVLQLAKAVMTAASSGQQSVAEASRDAHAGAQMHIERYAWAAHILMHWGLPHCGLEAAKSAKKK